VLEQLDHGILIVTSNGEVLLANKLAITQLSESSALGIVHGRVHARAADDDHHLDDAIKDAANRGRRKLLMLGAPTPTPVAITPISTSGSPTSNPVLISLSRHTTELAMQFMSRAYGLTVAEASLLKDVYEQVSAKEMASRRGIAISTVRSHLISVRMKTGTASMRQLIQQIESLPPLPVSVPGNVPGFRNIDASLATVAATGTQSEQVKGLVDTIRRVADAEKTQAREMSLKSGSTVTLSDQVQTSEETTSTLSRLPLWVRSRVISVPLKVRLSIAGTGPSLAADLMDEIPPTVQLQLLEPIQSREVDNIVVVGLFPSGAARTVGFCEGASGPKLNVRAFDFWGLIDPDGSSGNWDSYRSECEVVLVALNPK
jgi:DNA-binding CsgD family transcriptional regulator